MNPTIKDRTKIMFAEQLMKMMEETTLDKVRVTELVRRCGTTAPTFYYHFKDKYELVAWIYLRDYSYTIDEQGAEYTPQKLAAVMQKMEEKRPFYKKAFSADSQNSIASYVKDLSVDLAKEALERSGHPGPMPIEQEIAIKYHAHGIMGLLQEWILSRDPVDVFTLAEFMYSKTPDYLKESFSQVQYEPEELMSTKL